MSSDDRATSSPPIEMPRDNPTARPGRAVPAEGADGLFTQSWFPICLSSDVNRGEVVGADFLDGRVVVYRGEDGVVCVMSAYCPHLGADLSVGEVCGNELRCAFHHWEYDRDGVCSRTAIGDTPPPGARLFKFPSVERFGIVWAFNGNEPLWEVPGFEHPDDELVVQAYRGDEYACDPWVFAANTPDMQHIKVVHGVEFGSDDPHDEVDWEEWGFRYSFEGEHQGGVGIEWRVGIRGTSVFWQEGQYGDVWLGGIVGFALPRPGVHRVFAGLAVQQGDGSDEALAQAKSFLNVAEQLMHRTLGEDRDILNTIHYRQGTLTHGDRTLSRYLKFLRGYPRAHPSAPFIR